MEELKDLSIAVTMGILAIILMIVVTCSIGVMIVLPFKVAWWLIML